MRKLNMIQFKHVIQYINDVTIIRATFFYIVISILIKKLS